MQAQPNNPSEIDQILTTFLELDCDPLALAEHLGVNPFGLIDFFDRPDVAERLEKLEALIARGERLRESKAKASALAALQRIVEDEDTDPAERRRAAATILRSISKTRQRGQASSPPAEPPTDSPDNPDPPADPHPEARPVRNGSTSAKQSTPERAQQGTSHSSTIVAPAPARAVNATDFAHTKPATRDLRAKAGAAPFSPTTLPRITQRLRSSNDLPLLNRARAPTPESNRQFAA